MINTYFCHLSYERFLKIPYKRFRFPPYEIFHFLIPYKSSIGEVEPKIPLTLKGMVPLSMKQSLSIIKLLHKIYILHHLTTTLSTIPLSLTYTFYFNYFIFHV